MEAQANEQLTRSRPPSSADDDEIRPCTKRRRLPSSTTLCKKTRITCNNYNHNNVVSLSTLPEDAVALIFRHLFVTDGLMHDDFNGPNSALSLAITSTHFFAIFRTLLRSHAAIPPALSLSRRFYCTHCRPNANGPSFKRGVLSKENDAEPQLPVDDWGFVEGRERSKGGDHHVHMNEIDNDSSSSDEDHSDGDGDGGVSDDGEDDSDDENNNNNNDGNNSDGEPAGDMMLNGVRIKGRRHAPWLLLKKLDMLHSHVTTLKLPFKTCEKVTKLFLNKLIEKKCNRLSHVSVTDFRNIANSGRLHDILLKMHTIRKLEIFKPSTATLVRIPEQRHLKHLILLKVSHVKVSTVQDFLNDDRLCLHSCIVSFSPLVDYKYHMGVIPIDNNERQGEIQKNVAPIVKRLLAHHDMHMVRVMNSTTSLRHEQKQCKNCVYCHPFTVNSNPTEDPNTQDPFGEGDTMPRIAEIPRHNPDYIISIHATDSPTSSLDLLRKCISPEHRGIFHTKTLTLSVHSERNANGQMNTTEKDKVFRIDMNELFNRRGVLLRDGWSNGIHKFKFDTLNVLEVSMLTPHTLSSHHDYRRSSRKESNAKTAKKGEPKLRQIIASAGTGLQVVIARAEVPIFRSTTDIEMNFLKTVMREADNVKVLCLSYGIVHRMVAEGKLRGVFMHSDKLTNVHLERLKPIGGSRDDMTIWWCQLIHGVIAIMESIGMFCPLMKEFNVCVEGNKIEKIVPRSNPGSNVIHIRNPSNTNNIGCTVPPLPPPRQRASSPNGPSASNQIMHNILNDPSGLMANICKGWLEMWKLKREIVDIDVNSVGKLLEMIMNASIDPTNNSEASTRAKASIAAAAAAAAAAAFAKDSAFASKRDRRNKDIGFVHDSEVDDDHNSVDDDDEEFW